MFGGFGFGSRGLTVGCALSVLALAVAAAAPGASAASEVEEATSFTAPCILGPGILDIEATATITARADHPAEVRSGEDFQFNGASIVVKLPPEQSEQFRALGAATVKGTITNFPATVTHASPASLNLADSTIFSEGLPFAAPVESGGELVLTGPSEGRTSVWGPLTVTGNSGNVTLTASPAAAFVESEVGFKATGNGIVASISGYNAEGAKVVGSLKLVCNPPEDLLASVPIAGPPPPPPPPTEAPSITSVTPGSGPSEGGTTVTITGYRLNNASTVEFGGKKARSFTVNSSESITAVSPEQTVLGPSTLITVVTVTTPGGTSPISYTSSDEFSYKNARPVTEHLTFTKWTLAGTLTPKPLGQAIVLPSGSSFNGSGEFNAQTNQGSVSGSVSIPTFKTSLKLFGFVPSILGMTATQVGALSGTIAPSKTVSGDEALTLPLQLKLGFTSLGLLGLNIPTTCATSAPVSLTLVEDLSREALVSKGWSFSGSATVPKITCQGGLLGALYGEVISGLISGSGATYALSITPPGS